MADAEDHWLISVVPGFRGFRGSGGSRFWFSVLRSEFGFLGGLSRTPGTSEPRNPGTTCAFQAFGPLNIQLMPYGSVTMPNVAPQNVSCSGIVTRPPMARPLNISVISATSSQFRQT